MKFTETKKALNQLVADLSQASAAIHQVHWYLRGTCFKEWHEMMDDYRELVEGQLDEVAERLIIIDGAPFSTLEEFVAQTSIKSEAGDYTKSLHTHIERVVSIFRSLADAYQALILAAGDEDDFVSQDLGIGAKAEIEKTIWMLQAELGKAPGIDA